MKVGLHDCELDYMPNKTFPNFALMKISAWHKCEKPYADGRERWKYEDANFYVWSGHPLAKTAKTLQVGDCVEVFGVLCVSNYISATGKQKRYFEWKLEKLVVLYHFDGNLPKDEEYTAATGIDENELDDFSEFDDL